MGNKKISVIPISKEIILNNVKEANYSIRRLAKEVGYSARTICAYLDRGEMPKELVDAIDNILRPKKHRITVTIVAELDISDDEFDYLQYVSSPTTGDIELVSDDVDTLWALGRNHYFISGVVSKESIEEAKLMKGMTEE